MKALSYIPAPNRTPNNPFNRSGNWQEAIGNPNTRDYHTVRIDYRLSDKTNLFGRYMLSQPELSATDYTLGFGPADPNAVLLDNRRQNVADRGSSSFPGPTAESSTTPSRTSPATCAAVTCW